MTNVSVFKDEVRGSTSLCQRFCRHDLGLLSAVMRSQFNAGVHSNGKKLKVLKLEPPVQ